MGIQPAARWGERAVFIEDDNRVMGLGMEFRMLAALIQCQSGWRVCISPGDNEEMVAETANMNDAVCVWSDVHMESAGRAEWIRWVPPDIN